MTKELERMDHSLRDAQHMGKVLSCVFSVLLGAFVIIVGLVVAHVVGEMRSIDASGVIHLKGGGELWPVAAIPILIVGATILVVLQGISSDIACGHSPFSIAHARKIAFLGIAFLLNALVPLIASAGNIEIDLVFGILACNPNPLVLYIPGGPIVDFGSLVAALVALALALLWRYGALLQQQSDDLV